jgi:phosphoribosylformylglycinamidine cyclo-ligase
METAVYSAHPIKKRHASKQLLQSEIFRGLDMDKQKLTYKSAGVDIDKANALVDDIKRIAKRTHRSGILAGIGGFGAMFEIPEHFKHPVLVSGTDGVGTKLKLALELNQHDHIGIDLVAMCANDIVCCGAEPLFFLDYYATGQLNTEQARAVLTGIGRGCEQAGCALIGGETAEMPGMYHGDDYDLAGFCVGAVEKSQIIDGTLVKPGNVIIGLASSGPHANGFSLIRHVINTHHISLDTQIEGKALSAHLLEPTRLYIKSLLSLRQQQPIHALAHITGGGLTENLPRVLPAHTQAKLTYQPEQWPAIFQWLQQTGNIDTEEMIKSFNVGIGMAVIVDQRQVDAALTHLQMQGEHAFIIGEIQSQTDATPQVCFA